MNAVFKWSDERRTAALRLAEGNLTDAQIATEVGVCRRTIWSWKQIPEFSATIESHLEEFRQEVRRRGLASRERRIRALNDRWDRLQRIMEERAADPKMAEVPGGATGLLLHNVKGVGAGEKAKVLDLYTVDTGLLKELRELEKQAAQELGQWVERQEVRQLTKAYVTVGPDDL
ncbi:phBC6A51 family helix-turn-helix protein [Singulisphaera sp. GP187]|uniref:phBC6A51 family helix-turn-helix protein n=1 Tax=Singulisphaera sp. GP187 TaxID=1882752 RepID=UPI00116124C0|nr:phBC6A51 family helix-turn-helix protein [Singulisphaera sp. GP187]